MWQVARKPDQAVVMLTVATLFWGLSFPLTKSWQLAVGDTGWNDLLSANTLIAVRIGSALVLFALIRPGLVWRPSWRAHVSGLALGVINFLGFILQVVGLAATTPANCGFYTSLSSVWAPILAWFALGEKVRLPTFLGLCFGLVGATVLGVQAGTEWTLGRGEAITLASSIFFGIMIVMLDRIGKRFPSGHLTAGYMAGTGLPALLLAVAAAFQSMGTLTWLDQVRGVLTRPAVARDIVLLTVFCSVLATHFFTVYQPRLSAARASLIYLMEPVFATCFSLTIGHDALSARLAVGGGFILFGNLIVELPRLWREFRRAA